MYRVKGQGKNNFAFVSTSEEQNGAKLIENIELSARV
jgi:hypothetical protein